MWSFSAGNAKIKSKATKMMSDAVIGLILTLTSGLMLQVINPNLVNVSGIFNPLKKIEKIEIKPSADSVPSVDGFVGAPYIDTNPTNMIKTEDLLISKNIQCKPYGNLSNIESVAKSFSANMSYREGSRNGIGSDVNFGQCPSNRVCYDGLGYVKQVLYCSGFSVDNNTIPATIAYAPTIQDLFNNGNAQRINITDGCKAGNVVNNIKLVPGDVLGWYSSDVGGHAVLYVGNGLYVYSYLTSGPTDNSFGIYSDMDVQEYGRNICGYWNKLKNTSERYKNANVELKIVRVRSQ